jgi:long-chain acyl-CoA synthetase
MPGVEMRIFNDEDEELPPGEVGEIVVRGENVMLGYRNQPEETADAMRCGWYHTGDLGRMDEDGYFFIVDRKKDMIIVGGLNVYPREIEEVLYSHPAVLDAAVLGVPDRKRGEEPIAVVALKPGQEVTGLDLIRYCRERLANYKIPRHVVFRESLPRGGTGKVVKRLLRKEMEMEA